MHMNTSVGDHRTEDLKLDASLMVYPRIKQSEKCICTIKRLGKNPEFLRTYAPGVYLGTLGYVCWTV